MVDHAESQKVLRLAYHKGRGVNLHEAVTISNLEDEALPIDMLIERFGSMDNGAVQWLKTAPMGSIRLKSERADMTWEKSDQFYSFTDTPSQASGLQLGTTHVAIGFVDLGHLSAACVEQREEWLAVQSAGNGSPTKPLLWVGYECAPINVAKTRVLLQMMQSGADIDAVLQVRANFTFEVPPTGDHGCVVMVGWHICMLTAGVVQCCMEPRHAGRLSCSCDRRACRL
jgi:hypothetical protein